MTLNSSGTGYICPVCGSYISPTANHVCGGSLLHYDTEQNKLNEIIRLLNRIIDKLDRLVQK
jgi:hypothetical protein